MKELIYLDHAATTPTHPTVVDAMQAYYTDQFSNPSSIYEFAQKSKMAIEEARETIAKFIGGKEKEIFFTSGGTEADNWAIKGIAEAYESKGKHIITSKIEHHAVLHTCEYLEKKGYDLTYLDVDDQGIIDLKDLENAIREDTILISIMYANNEIGSLQPIKEIGQLAKDKGVIFHTDAVQGLGHMDIDVTDLNIDLMSMSGHKLYGPKGIGALYVRQGIRLKSFIHGGAQERNRRGGTENVPGIIGFAKAVDRLQSNLAKEAKREADLRDYLIHRVVTEIPHAKLNGHPSKRLPNNANFSFEFVEGESLLIMLDMKGIAGSSGSACTSGSLDPSHVLLAIGLPHEIAHGSLRITLGESNTKDQVDQVVEDLKVILKRLRDMSPLYEDYKKGINQAIIK